MDLPPAPDEDTTRPNRFIGALLLAGALDWAVIVIDSPVLTITLGVLSAAGWIGGVWAAVRLYRGALPPGQVRAWAVVFGIACIITVGVSLAPVFGW